MARTSLKAFIISLVILGSVILAFIAFGAGYSRYLCDEPGYTCIKVSRGQSWERLWPDAEKRRTIMRINRMNTQLYSGMTVAVPNNLDNSKQAFAAYDRAGYLIHWGPVSTAKGWCPDIQRNCSTPTGTFYFYSKGGQGCYSTIYPVPDGGAPMPYCMYFYKGFALHAGELPGYNDSHGCVRLFYEDAAWLNKNFVELGRFGTKIIVTE
jgi:L,D-transpeptidase ErfK/SrfK